MSAEHDVVAHVRYQIDCPACEDVFDVENDPTGETVECTSCGTQLHVTESRWASVSSCQAGAETPPQPLTTCDAVPIECRTHALTYIRPCRALPPQGVVPPPITALRRPGAHVREC